MIIINSDRKISHQYMDALIIAIQEKRELSAKELCKTNLIRESNIEVVDEWYYKLFQFVLKNPPKSYVIKLIVCQNQSEVMSIRYIYSEDDKEPKEVIISIDSI